MLGNEDAGKVDRSNSVVVILFPYVEEGSTNGTIPFAPIERELFNGTRLQIGRKVDRKRQRITMPLITGIPDGNGAFNGSTPAVCSLVAEEDVDEAPGAPPASEGPSATEKASGTANEPTDAPDNCLFISFRSKVVSRHHAEIWFEDGIVRFRDVGSSSGTFVNRLRLSSSNKPSRPCALDSGDLVQFGVDYQGRQEDIFKCVTVRVIIRPKAALGNQLEFNKSLHALSRSFQASSISPASSSCSSAVDCCICLSCLGPQTAMFISPCAHTFHFKCIIPLLHGGVMFHCPLCRGWFNLWKNLPAGESNCSSAKRPQLPALPETDAEADVLADNSSLAPSHSQTENIVPSELESSSMPRASGLSDERPILDARHSTQSFETSATLGRPQGSLSPLRQHAAGCLQRPERRFSESSHDQSELSLLSGLCTPATNTDSVDQNAAPGSDAVGASSDLSSVAQGQGSGNQQQSSESCDGCIMTPLNSTSFVAHPSTMSGSSGSSSCSPNAALASALIISEAPDAESDNSSLPSSSSSSSSEPSASEFASPNNSKLYLDVSDDLSKSESSPTIKKILVKIRSRMSLKKWHYPATQSHSGDSPTP